MERNARLIEVFKGMFPGAPVQVRPATVVSVSGRTCTVDLIGTDLVGIESVNLVADEEAKDGLLLTPKVGSLVYVSALENALDSLFVCSFSEIDKLDVTIGKAAIHMEATSTIVQYDKAVVTLKDNLVTIANDKTSLVEIVGDLLSLLESFQVICANPGAPSASVFPATLVKLTAVKSKFKLLFQ